MEWKMIIKKRWRNGKMDARMNKEREIDEMQMLQRGDIIPGDDRSLRRDEQMVSFEMYQRKEEEGRTEVVTHFEFRNE